MKLLYSFLSSGRKNRSFWVCINAIPVRPSLKNLAQEYCYSDPHINIYNIAVDMGYNTLWVDQ